MENPPINPSDLTSLLQSGGNIAAMIAIYIAMQIKKVVKTFFDDVVGAIKQNVATNMEVIAAVKALRDDIQALHTQLAVTHGITAPRFVQRSKAPHAAQGPVSLTPEEHG